MTSKLLRVVAAVAAAAMATGAYAVELGGGEALDYPHAGVAFVIPPGYQQQVVAQPFELAKAVLIVDKKPIQAVTVSALPLEDPSATAEDLAEGILAAQSSNLAIRNMQVLSKAAMKAADMPGAARFISYTFRGDDMVAASAVFCRELSDRKGRMQYVVTVEATADRKGEVLPVLGEVVKSVRLLAVVRPIDIGVCPLGKQIDSPDGRYSLALPHGWYRQPTPAGIAIAQTDYTLAGQPGLSAMVVETDLPAGTTARQHAERCVQAAIDAARNDGMSAQVFQQGLAKLAGQEAWQTVFEERLAAPTTAPSQPASAAGPQPSTSSAHPDSAETQAASGPTEPPVASEVEPANVVFIQRSLSLQPPLGQSGARCLSIVLICPDASPQTAEAAIEKLAAGVSLRSALPAATAPATQPATAAPR